MLEKDTKRILHIGAGDFIYRGVEKILTDYYQNIDRSKLQFDFLTPGVCKNEDLREKIEVLGGKVIELNVLNCHSRIKRYILFGKGILKILRNGDYAVVHANTGSVVMLSLISFFAWIGHAKIRIAHSHNDGKTTIAHKIKKCVLYPLLMICPTHYFACSQSAGQYVFPKAVWNKINVIPNGIDTRRFCYNEDVRIKMRKELKINNRFAIGCVGAFTEQKNHKFLFDIFEKTHRICVDAVLVLVGAGELLEQMKDRVSRDNLSDSVVFVGTSNRVNEILQAMDCFVLPSIYEGLGIAAIEAQAAGLPTLCSDVLPPETKVTGLIEYMSLSSPANEWASKILSYQLIHERPDTSVEIMKSEYDIQTAAKKLEQIYLSLID